MNKLKLAFLIGGYSIKICLLQQRISLVHRPITDTDLEACSCPIVKRNLLARQKKTCELTLDTSVNAIKSMKLVLGAKDWVGPIALATAKSCLEDVQEAYDLSLETRAECDFHIQEADKTCNTMVKGLACRTLTFDQLALDIGIDGAKRIRRRALLTGWLWFPQQSFATQGIAEFLFMLLLPGRTETLEALCEINLTLYKEHLKTRSQFWAISAYWKNMIVDAWSVCEVKWKRRINIGALAGAGAAVWHWSTPIMETANAILRGLGIH